MRITKYRLAAALSAGAMLVASLVAAAPAAHASMTGFKAVQRYMGWVDFTGDGRADFCAAYGGNYLECSFVQYQGNGFTGSARVTNVDEGYDAGRAWADVTGDHRADYCRVIGGSNKVLQCNPSTGVQFGTAFTSGAIDPGYDAGRAWADVNGDGMADYCRVVGLWSYQIRCTKSAGHSFGSEITSPTLDPGYDQGRAWVDVTGDGRADYCRITGSGSKYLTCTIATSTGFGATVTSSVIDPGYDDSRRWGDVNGDSRADYCRIVGNVLYSSTTLQCTLATATGFGATFTSPTLDAGYSDSGYWADFTGDGRDDYCRQVDNNVARCTPSQGTYLDTVSYVGSAPGGYVETIGFVDMNLDGRADYCSTVGSNGLMCQLSTGSGWGTVYTGTVP
jgi:FlaG/FlaF family flagellin (archaellin)